MRILISALLAVLLMTTQSSFGASREAQWKEVQAAREKGLPQTAIEKLQPIEAAAIEEEAWGEAVRAIALRVTLEGQIQGAKPEEKILRMREELEGAAEPMVGLLQTIQAHWYWQYYQQNRWRILQRTMTSEAPGEDFVTWDLARLLAEIDRRFQLALSHGEMLKQMPIGAFDEFLVKGAVPDRYRPTLYDFIAHEALGFYTAGEQGVPRPVDDFRVGADDPIFDSAGEFQEWEPEVGGEAYSAVARAIGLYQELMRFHEDDADRTAYLDVDLARLRFGYNVAVGESKEARYVAALAAFVEEWADHELAATALYQHAAVLHRQDDLAEAHELARRGAEIYPESMGGRQCHNLVTMIETPSVFIHVERVLNEPLSPILVQYKNLTNLWFRAVQVDWSDAMDQRRNRYQGIDANELKELLGREAAMEWSVSLPATLDFKERTEEVPAPEDLSVGFYFLIASARPDFSAEDNVVAYGKFWVSELALVVRPSMQETEGFVLDAKTGDPVRGAEVASWYWEPETVRVPRDPVVTDDRGMFRLGSIRGNGYEIRVRHEGQELGLETPMMDYYHGGEQEVRPRSLIFTDRKVYRPGQMIQYKGITFRTDQNNNDYRVLAGRKVTVVFSDVNGQEIARAEHTANDYGSFSGSFTAPRGRLLGSMGLTTTEDPESFSMVLVEEYKRPKFQVTLNAPTTAVRLNEAVTVTGKAESYTGAAVDGAEVSYRVVREVRWPVWWWEGMRGGPRGRSGVSQEIGQGQVRTDAAGNFSIEFVAQADPGVSAEDEPIFEFRVHADVTDTTGETRSHQRTVRVGFTALQAAMEADEWQVVQESVVLKVKTQTLDDEPARAEGVVKLYRLRQPATVQRKPLQWWVGRHVPTVDLSDPANWELGELVSEEGFTASENGVAELRFQLPVGAYRAMLETQDRYGKLVTARLPIRVLDPEAGRLAIPVPSLVSAPSWTVEPGESFVAVWGTGYDFGRAYVEVEHRGKIIRSFWTEAGQTQVRIEQAVTEEMRGGFHLHITHVKENRLYSDRRMVDVPWSNKDLELRWEHFTSKLGPADRETWTAVVQGPGGEGAVAEMVATLYDASLDQFALHEWYGWSHLPGTFYVDGSRRSAYFANAMEMLQYVYGNWRQEYREVPMGHRHFPPELGIASYQEGPMLRGFDVLSGSGSRAISSQAMMAAAPAMGDAALPMDMETGLKRDDSKRPVVPSVRLEQVTARQNLNETAFFFPHLVSDSNGVVRMTFSMPEALTTWQFMGIAHDRELRSGSLRGRTITAKDLMVQPNPPRFVREGDEIEFTVKVQNQSAARQTGQVRLTFNDAASDQSVDELLSNTEREHEFDIPGGESRSYSWRIQVPDGVGFLTYRAVAATSRLSDGEEGYLPVLARRVLVTESLPLPIRGPGEKEFEFTKLLESGGSQTLEHQGLVVQMVSNPGWYAVLALPYLMEFPYECTEQTFNRLYANALARHIANSDPRIRRVFDLWKQIEIPESPLERNGELKMLALEETPWLRQARNESQARKNLGVLFDENRLNDEMSRVRQKLGEQRLVDGAWPWFPGGPPNDYITLYIVTGFGRLRHLGVELDMGLYGSIERLDRWMTERYERIQRQPTPEDYVLSPTDALYLYGRSFFLRENPVKPEHRAAVEFFLGQGRKHWLQTENRQTQGHLALGLKRFNAFRASDDTTPSDIMRSIKERAVRSEEMGMFWRDTEYSWWWYRAPIETQALMIEAFDEVLNDADAVEECRVWLLKQKQTQDWKTTKATADAVYALLLRGTDALASEVLVEVEAGGRDLTPGRDSRGMRGGAGGVEPGTGFYEHRFEGTEIEPALGRITVKKVDSGVAWGGVHWQYLEELGKVTPHEGTPLQLRKRLFTKVNTDRGPVLEPVAGAVTVGAELVVRIEVRVDRDMEYVHLKDQRGSGTEPVNVLSGYRYQDGLAYYESTRDVASHFFIDYLPKGIYVFEYSTRVQLRGVYETGVATIQCMYAPEFNSHSESLQLNVR